jgi:hypothetical protein
VSRSIPRRGLIAVVAVLATWAVTASADEPQDFDGLYFGNFEYSTFAPRRSGCPGDADWYLWRVRDSEFEQRFRAFYPHYSLYPSGVEGGYVWVHFRGTRTGPRADLPWGHEYAVSVEDVYSMFAVEGCEIEVTTVYLPSARRAMNRR